MPGWQSKFDLCGSLCRFVFSPFSGDNVTGFGGLAPSLRDSECFVGFAQPTLKRGARVVLQFMCSIQFRARWLFLKEKATYHRAFGVQQLENSYNQPCACGARRLAAIDTRHSGPSPLEWPPAIKTPALPEGIYSWGRLPADWRARRAAAQPSLVTWWARATLSDAAGTSLVMQEPAPM